MPDVMLGFRVWFQDYTGWRTQFPDATPERRWLDFADRADAERELRLQRAAGREACITSIPIPRAQKAAQTRKRQSRIALPLARARGLRLTQ